MNIVRTAARKSSNRLKFFCLKVICCVCQSNELKREIKQKIGGSSRGPAENLGRAMAHPGLPLEPSLWRYLGLWRRLLDNGEIIMRISHLLLHNITSQGNDKASLNESKKNFSDASLELFYSVRINRMMSPSDADDLGRPCNSLLEFQVVQRCVFIMVQFCLK